MARLLATLALVSLASAQESSLPRGALHRLPVREITVFKDGHALLLHEGTLPVDAAGDVHLDHLPAPVMGTFWPFSSDPAVKLKAVVAGRKKVLTERPALSVRELLEANVGAEVFVEECDGRKYACKIAGLPQRNPAAPEAVAEPVAPGNLVLLETLEGCRAVAVDRIRDLTFRGKFRKTLEVEQVRNVLTLKLDRGTRPAGEPARVGVLYLQKGVRWIPSYKVDLDDNGKAAVKLQATLLNELADIQDVTLNLVIGVPSFAFKETVDPIALQQNGSGVARLSSYFENNARTAYALSNAVQTQVARMGEHRGAAIHEPGAAGDERVADGSRNEDLFVFTVRGISVRKGECMVLPVAEFGADYQDVFALDIPIQPPREVQRNVSGAQQAELERLLHSPKVAHKIRLANSGAAPFTTAPALVFRKGRVLAQGMMTYTAPGGRVDLALTSAVDVAVRKTEEQKDRVRHALTWRGSAYDRIHLTGGIRLTNQRPAPIEVEVTRYVLGEAETADPGSRVETVNLLEDDRFLPPQAGVYGGWYAYNWPWWWQHLNSVSRITWKVRVEAGQEAQLHYAWHYFWQ